MASHTLNFPGANLNTTQVTTSQLTMNTVNITSAFSLDNICVKGNTTSRVVQFTNPTTGLVTTSNVVVGKDLAVSSNVIVGGHILPSGNELSDLGAPDNKFRDLYISDNSLWVGDTTKIAFSGGKMRFRKRKTNIVPAAVTNAGGNQSAALAHAGKAALTDMKLEDWRNYGKSLNASLEVSDIFTDTDADYEVDEIVNTVYPVGSIYLSVNGTNPGSLPSFAGTTWVAYGEGRTLIGVGSVTDSQPTPETQAFSTVEDTGGELKHTLTKAEIPPHVHTEKLRTDHNNAGPYGSPGGPYHTDTLNSGDGSVDKDGNVQLQGLAHNNMQPYIVTYMWKRTA